MFQIWIFISTNYYIDFLIIAQKIEELEAALHKKDEDMKSMEERYKMYLEKARIVSIIFYKPMNYLRTLELENYSIPTSTL